MKVCASPRFLREKQEALRETISAMQAINNQKKLHNMKQYFNSNETFEHCEVKVSQDGRIEIHTPSFYTAELERLGKPEKTIRGRVMAYLSSISLRKGKPEFDIPFDRQQLANYLNVERTALSKELGRMQNDGILRCCRSHFVLLDL
jgi:CRP-like cAMP-binding protein